MKIAVNVSWMAPGKAGGMEWYVRALIDELAMIDDKNNYLLITSHLNDHTFEVDSPRWEKLAYFGDETNPVSYRRLPSPHPDHSPPHLDQMLRSARVDLLFSPLMYGLPVMNDIPTVVTIPDLQHKGLPELFVDFELGSRNVGFPDSVHRATAVLGISNHVAQEIRRTYDVEEERVVATPLGLSPDFVSDPDIIANYTQGAHAQYRIEGRYVLFPGNAWPHKNHVRLIEAFEQVCQQVPDLKLILTGEHAVGSLIPPRLRRHVDHLGYVSREEIIGLMAGAEALVFPSRFEGFGLPLLEAMAVNTPILCSELPTLREVGGDVPAYFDPDSVESIAKTIIDFSASDSEATRQRSLMATQVAKFTYRSTAETTLRVFNEIESGARAMPELPARPNRPLDGRSELVDGVARWSIDAPELTHVELTLVAAPHVADGRSRLPSIVALNVNGVLVGEQRVEAGGSSHTVNAEVPSWLARNQLQEIELQDISHPQAKEASAVRVGRLVAVDATDGDMRLI